VGIDHNFFPNDARDMDVAEMDIAACPLTLISDRDLKDQ